VPELPEVESARRMAARVLTGRRIVAVATVRDSIMYAGISPMRFASALRGRMVRGVGRRGKHLWLELDCRPWPAFHFGMTGYFEKYSRPEERPRFWKMELLLDNHTRFALSDARRLGRIRLLNDPANEPPICDLGFDPLSDSDLGPRFVQELRRRKAPVKAVLLDQSFSAGVGNWIADEVLYQSKIRPQRRGCDLSPAEAQCLFRKVIAVIRRAVDVDGNNDRYPRTWLFHYRWGKMAGAVTFKGEKIVHETIGGRTTAWVPAVQK